MKTEVFAVPSLEGHEDEIERAARIIVRGGLLAIPTETVYGLGANGLDAEAVRHIFEAKGRPQDNPLILHIPDASWLERYCSNVPRAAYRLAERFWPGPLTMILPRKENVPDVTTGGLDTVGMRCPDHALTLAILRAADLPIAAPSANRSGRPSCTTAGHVLADMDGCIDGIVDGGACAVGVESTIIDLTCDPPQLLRPGGLPLEALREVLGEVTVDKAVVSPLGEGEKPRAPGMKYRHYAPKAPVTVVTGDARRSAHYIAQRMTEKAGILCFDEFAPLFDGHVVHTLGASDDKRTQAQRVFDALRSFDDTDVSEIYAQCPDSSGLGLAIANRLKKAAGFHVIDMDSSIVIGITGGTGAGKTSALQALEDLGAYILDADEVYHQLLSQDTPLKREVQSAFSEAFDASGTLAWKKLGSIVFSDAQKLKELDSIVHTHMPREILARMEGKPLVGLDAIKLIESGLGELCDVTLAVTAPDELRVRRIMARDGISEAYARSRIAAQKGEDYYRTYCDHVLENTASDAAQFRAAAREFFRTRIAQIKEERRYE